MSASYLTNLLTVFEMDPEDRRTKQFVDRIEREREMALSALRTMQRRLTALIEAVEDDNEWLQAANSESCTLGYTGIGTTWAEAQGRLARIAAMIEALG